MENIPNFSKLIYTVILVATLVVGVMQRALARHGFRRGSRWDWLCCLQNVKYTALWKKFVTSDAKAGFFMQLIEISAVLCNYWIEVLYRRHFY